MDNYVKLELDAYHRLKDKHDTLMSGGMVTTSGYCGARYFTHSEALDELRSQLNHKNGLLHELEVKMEDLYHEISVLQSKKKTKKRFWLF